MSEATLTLPEFAGQNCDVEIIRRKDGSVYVSFKSDPHYGYPSLGLEELKYLLKKTVALSDE